MLRSIAYFTIVHRPQAHSVKKAQQLLATLTLALALDRLLYTVTDTQMDGEPHMRCRWSCVLILA